MGAWVREKMPKIDIDFAAVLIPYIAPALFERLIFQVLWEGAVMWDGCLD